MLTTKETAAASRGVGVLGVTIFALGCGEELWQAYMPAYLVALGAGTVAVGLFGTIRDLLDSMYQYPGGWIADRFGRARALLLFTALATAGYAVYALARTWQALFAGLLLVMCWKAGAFSTTFAMIADAVPAERRTAAFSIQSVLVRLPRIISAPVGGLIIAAAGLIGGVRLLFAASLALGLLVLTIQRFLLRERRAEAIRRERAPAAAAIIPANLRRLFAAECLVRIGEGLAASFIILFLLQERGVSAAAYGGLYALQQTVALISYLPSAYVAAYIGRRPVIALTFVCFALFPLAVRTADGQLALVGAFLIGGLKEIGEPARKAFIVTLAPDDRRASTVGLYYTFRNLLVVPAGIAGGLLAQRALSLPLEVAAIVGLLGVVVFLWPTPSGVRS
jgi:MFS family permease